MSETKRQHTVPKVYLKQFSFQKKNRQHIWTYDKRTGKSFESSIENIAVERDFYTLDAAENKLAWEEFYSNQVEPLIAKYIARLTSKASSPLIQNNAIIINEEEKQMIALLMAYQLNRGQIARRHIHSFAKDASAQLLIEIEERYGRDDGKYYFAEQILKYDDSFLKVAMADAITNGESVSKIGNAIAERTWLLYRIIGNLEFVTSDHPVTFVDSDNRNSDPFAKGLISPRTVVHFPISPKLMIAAYKRGLFFESLDEYDCKLVFLEARSNQTFIRESNKRQLSNCFRQVFAMTSSTIEDLGK